MEARDRRREFSVSRVPRALDADEGRRLGRYTRRTARAEHDRVALQDVARVKASFGIVYSSDAPGAQSVRVVGVSHADAHEPIVYSIALKKFAKRQAEAFDACLTRPKEHDIVVKYGGSVHDHHDR